MGMVLKGRGAAARAAFGARGAGCLAADVLAAGSLPRRTAPPGADGQLRAGRLRRRRAALLGAVSAGLLAASAGRAGAQAPAGGLAARARAAGFTFGTAVTAARLADDPVYAAQVAAEARLLVPEWEAEWAAIQPNRGQFEFGPLAAVVDFAQGHGQQVRGHTLVWHQDMPPWLLDAIAEGPDQARGILAAHCDGVLPTTRPAIRDWDVVNEAIADTDGNPFTAASPSAGDLRDTPWLRALGPGYIELAFRLARERDRTLRLTYNDYGLEGDTPWAEEKRQRVLRLLRRLLDAQCPIDALGLQAHLMIDGSPAGALRRLPPGRKADGACAADHRARCP